LAALIDRLRPDLADGFGGPFNGQARRIEMVRDMFATVDFRVVVETGTYRATTALFLKELSDSPLATIEAQSRYYHYASRRLRGVPNITLLHSDSPRALRVLAAQRPWNSNPAFFYLDAHWLDSLPLIGELQMISRGWADYAVLVDDFKVPDDPGYAYDDYGPSGVLELPLLEPISTSPVAVYLPAAHSSTETGARRGSVVLATTGSVDDRLQRLASLRRIGLLESTLGGASREALNDHRPRAVR
jgi:hypothetical protein